MNDRQLRYAITIWHERSFSRAAEKLGVSQPSLSEQVRLLEDELGFSLFDRSSRGVEASINGRIFLQNANDVVIGMTGLKDLAHELRGTPGSTIHIGVCSSIAHAMIPHIARTLMTMSATIRLDLVTTTSRRIHRFLDMRRLDVGLLLEGDPKSFPHELTVSRLAESELILAVPAGHPIAALSTPVELTTVCDYPLIASEARIGYGRLVMMMFAAQGLTPNIVAECDNFESLKLLLMSGVGIALVPHIAVEREIASGAILSLPIRPSRKIALMLIRRNNPSPPRVEQCLERLTQELGETRPLTLAR